MSTSPATRPARILVIEDEDDILEVLKLLLEYEGHQVVTAKNGRAALAAATARPFDLVVMDVSMPGMSGIEIAHALRANPKTAEMRIVFHTGLDEHWVRDRFADYDLYLTKANDAEVLVDEIAALLARERAPRAETSALPAPTFSTDDASRARIALRSAMGLGPSSIGLAELLELLADEIGQLRRMGRSDEDIAALVTASVGHEIPTSALAAVGRRDE